MPKVTPVQGGDPPRQNGLTPPRLPSDQHTSPRSPLFSFPLGTWRSRWPRHPYSTCDVMQPFSGCSTNTIKNKPASSRLFRNSPTLPPQVPSLYWVPRITRGPREGQCFCTQALFPQLDHKKWKQSSFPPLQAEFSLMAELKSAIKRIQANELRPLHKGGRTGGA